MTATQIAAANRREREALADQLAVERGVADGPFDSSDLPAPPDETPPLGHLIAPRTGSGELDTAQSDLARRLVEATAAPDPAGRFAPGPSPRIVDGVVVPAASVADNPLATWVLLPVDQIATIGRTGRAVGVTPKTGRWLPVWIGDDIAVREQVLEQFAADYAEARKARR